MKAYTPPEIPEGFRWYFEPCSYGMYVSIERWRNGQWETYISTDCKIEGVEEMAKDFARKVLSILYEEELQTLYAGTYDYTGKKEE